jgi:hypothetical protein
MCIIIAIMIYINWLVNQAREGESATVKRPDPHEASPGAGNAAKTQIHKDAGQKQKTTRMCGMPAGRMEGIVTFGAFFTAQPRTYMSIVLGKHGSDCIQISRSLPFGRPHAASPYLSYNQLPAGCMPAAPAFIGCTHRHQLERWGGPRGRKRQR